MGWGGESGDCLASCIQMTWFCLTTRGRLKGNGGKYFVEVCRRKGLKINAGNSKMMVLGGIEV